MENLKFLAFDTSTDMMSVALSDGAQIWEHQGMGGAQASAQLIPVIQNLLSQATLQLSDLSALVVGQGPGSFTGLRTACAVAQGLALGANLKVIAVDTLMAVAEDARAQLKVAPSPADTHLQVGVIMDARMNEVYAGAYEWHADAHQWQTLMPLQVGLPEAAVQSICQRLGGHFVLAGNGLEVYQNQLNLQTLAPLKSAEQELIFMPAMPHATALLRLAPALWHQGLAVLPEHVQPHYIRDKVAQTTVEREAIKAAKAVLAEANNAKSESA
jgi:tRNA threonylcarbamoyladenosine biosynthesis protein TsaB